MQSTRAPSKGKGTSARRLGSCREVEGLTAFLGGQHSMGCELHTVVTKSVEVSDHSGSPDTDLLQKWLGYLPLSRS